MDWGNLLKTIGGAVAAPFTGGATVPLAISGAAGLAGGLSNTEGARTSTSMPMFSPQNQSVADMLSQRLLTKLNNPVSTPGYEANGITGINNAYRGVSQAINNNLTTRGLGTSPVAGNATVQTQLARGGDISRFENTLPMVQQQLDLQNIGSLQSFLNMMKGNKAVGAGSAAGSGIGSAAEMLAYLTGRGHLGNGSSGNPTAPDVGAILSGLGVS